MFINVTRSTKTQHNSGLIEFYFILLLANVATCPIVQVISWFSALYLHSILNLYIAPLYLPRLSPIATCTFSLIVCYAYTSSCTYTLSLVPTLPPVPIYNPLCLT